MAVRYGHILFVLFLGVLPACGKNFKNHRHAHKSDAAKPSGETEDAPGSAPAPETSTGGSAPSAGNAATSAPKFDESFLRKSALHYYQWDARLKDLFSTSYSSQLCWPAALAEEVEFQRTQDGAFSSLAEVGTGETKATDATRYFAGLCETNKETGTSVIQGVRCIDKYVREKSLTPEINVAGVDAQWAQFNYFPPGTTAYAGAVEINALKTAVSEEKSVLLLIGFYTKNPTTGALKRERGHFVAVTGFSYNKAWSDKRLMLRIMNPAVAPSGTTPEDAFESVELAKVTADEKAPAAISYSFNGKGFSDGTMKAYLESAVTFSASR